MQYKRYLMFARAAYLVFIVDTLELKYMWLRIADLGHIFSGTDFSDLRHQIKADIVDGFIDVFGALYRTNSSYMHDFHTAENKQRVGLGLMPYTVRDQEYSKTKVCYALFYNKYENIISDYPYFMPFVLSYGMEESFDILMDKVTKQYIVECNIWESIIDDKK